MQEELHSVERIDVYDIHAGKTHDAPACLRNGCFLHGIIDVQIDAAVLVLAVLGL